MGTEPPRPRFAQAGSGTPTPPPQFSPRHPRPFPIWERDKYPRPVQQGMTELPATVERALEDGADPENLSDHLSDVGDVIADMNEDIRAGNLIYCQQHVVERAVELLRESYDEADEYGEREAELMAVAILLSKEAENEVW